MTIWFMLGHYFLYKLFIFDNVCDILLFTIEGGGSV